MRNLIIEAARFANVAHAGQLRKYNGKPYHTHTDRVACRVMTFNDVTENAVATAFLHDTIEDFGVTALQLAGKFNLEIATWVSQLTNNSLDSRLPRAERKANDRKYLRQVNQWPRAIKFVDRIDNLSELLESARYDVYAKRFLKVYVPESKLLADALYEPLTDGTEFDGPLTLPLELFKGLHTELMALTQHCESYLAM